VKSEQVSQNNFYAVWQTAQLTNHVWQHWHVFSCSSNQHLVHCCTEQLA